MSSTVNPTQRSCESPTMWRQKAPMFSVKDVSVRPMTSGLSDSMAAQETSLPRPMVKVSP